MSSRRRDPGRASQRRAYSPLWNQQSASEAEGHRVLPLWSKLLAEVAGGTALIFERRKPKVHSGGRGCVTESSITCGLRSKGLFESRALVARAPRAACFRLGRFPREQAADGGSQLVKRPSGSGTCYAAGGWQLQPVCSSIQRRTDLASATSSDVRYATIRICPDENRASPRKSSAFEGSG